MSDEYHKSMPFNLYDFYGYIFPSVLLIIGTLIVLANFQILSLNSAFEYLIKLDKINFFLGLTLFIILASLTYFIGHIIATIAHLLYDRTIMRIIIGYPIIEMLDLPNNVRILSKAFNFYIIVLLNMFLLYPLFSYGFPPSYLLVIFGLLGALILSRIIISLLEKQDYFIKDVSILSPQLKDIKHWSKLFRYLHAIYCYIYRLTSKYFFSELKKTIGCADPFPESIINSFKNKIKRDFNLDTEDIGSNNYWLAAIKVVSKNPILANNLHNWLNLYGFLKNLSTVGFVVCTEFCFYYIITGSNFPKYSLSILIYFFAYLSSFILGMRYWIIYRNYYTKYVIRSYISLD